MYCGIILAGSTEEDSAVAFLTEDSTETFSVATNDDILELLEERRPEVTALNAPPTRATTPGKGSDGAFRSGEEELIDEGHAMLPQGMRDPAVLERADHLSRHIEASGIGTTLIESDAQIVSERLGIEGDDDLADREISPEDISSTWEFDAVVLALVAKLYADNQCEDYDIVVPEESTE